MARTWLAIKVEMLGGHGEDLWPYPGRVLLVGPSHTFADLAKAIDDAFARWDRAHLCQFTLADGTVVTDEESADDVQETPFGPIATAPLVLDRTKLTARIKPGDEFRYVFDFGDDWTYACAVEEAKVDPAEVWGRPPKVPTVVWGWGSIPDQYGRRFDGDAPGEPMPRRPTRPHAMLGGRWPEEMSAEPVDLQELRGATYRRDVPAILAAIEGREVDDLLQHVGMGVQVVLSADRERGHALVLSVIQRLEERALPGDEVLAEDLLAQLRGTPIAARHLPVDLSALADALSGDPAQPAGHLDLQTGEVVPGMLADPLYVSEGDDGYIDFDEEPDRWLELDGPDSRAQWRDMADFAARQTNADLRQRLESAIEGKGAFRRFRDVVHSEDLVEQWRRFSDERELGRACAYLADAGVRVLNAA
jgi:hypothetical protein